MKSFIKLLVPAALILLFTYAVVSKMAEVTRFRAQLYLQPFPHGFADLLVFALPAAECIAIVLLCFDRTRLSGLMLSVVLLCAFTFYILFILVFYQGKLPCSCGGILNHLSWTGHLIFNCAFILGGLTEIGLSRTRKY